MCIYIPPGSSADDAFALETFGRVMGDVMGEALDKWTEEDWAQVQREIADDEAGAP